MPSTTHIGPFIKDTYLPEMGLFCLLYRKKLNVLVTEEDGIKAAQLINSVLFYMSQMSDTDQYEEKSRFSDITPD